MSDHCPKLPAGTVHELVRRQTHEALLSRLEANDAGLLENSARLQSCIDELLAEVMADLGVTLDHVARETVAARLVADIGGMGPLAPLLIDKDVSDILINGPDEIWIDKQGRLKKTALRFDDETQLWRFLERSVESCGRSINFRQPVVDAYLPDGSRLHAVIPPLSQSGVVISIRRFRLRSPRRQELIDNGFITDAMLDCLETAVLDGRNIVISGSAGSGKTTLVNILSRYIPDGQRVVTIEDAAELNLEHRHVVRLEIKDANADGVGRIDMRALIRTALRMRADRLVIGEVRGGEVLDMLQAFSVGHDGGMTTIHANSVADTIRRLEALVLMHSPSISCTATRQMIGSAVDLVVHLHKSPDGERRVESVTAVKLDGESVTTLELFNAASAPPAPAVPAAATQTLLRRQNADAV